ncbi:hypothetical protein BCR32DRAFT_199345 [Anaeromyces robustus]|uniref:DUF202 domain-containing protein n=1 Tax=Anaeromyces robustus TaxID=1754192 RepID=A0A1Y1XKY3_9FUNG|nr:hypothetical protein BCR32DRAFT_199345 [Anaeromyces robustus]|eukprot:ORX86126.1 hypothetical protein BCR32DRAFT_199345 [Anaeromyces robustus]
MAFKNYEPIELSPDNVAKSNEALPENVSYPLTENIIPRYYLSKTHTRKPIAIPMRVEPKVWLSNERTFLSWCSTAIILASLAITILSNKSPLAKITGSLFSISSVIVMLYGLMMYEIRLNMIHRGIPGPYHNPVGPGNYININNRI